MRPALSGRVRTVRANSVRQQHVQATSIGGGLPLAGQFAGSRLLKREVGSHLCDESGGSLELSLVTDGNPLDAIGKESKLTLRVNIGT